LLIHASLIPVGRAQVQKVDLRSEAKWLDVELEIRFSQFGVFGALAVPPKSGNKGSDLRSAALSPTIRLHV
jgi:hypothetical protein